MKLFEPIEVASLILVVLSSIGMTLEQMLETLKP
jgi:hypothetical protein